MPHRQLMTALVEDAVRTYRTHWRARDREGRRRFAEAEAWLMDEHAHGPLSFGRVCELLGLPAAAIRRDLARWLVEARAAASGRHAA
jgi:hypothetical protein